MKKFELHIFLLVCALSLNSCKTNEKLVYFHKTISDTTATNCTNYTPIFKSDDFLSIIVTGEEPDAVTPFNLPTAGMPQTVNNGYTMGNPAPYGYLIG